MGIAQIWTKISPITVILVVFPLSFSACSSLDVGDGMLGMNSSPSTVRSLARDIDQLEEHIERYGSVTAKSPDVWGQARLTKIRNEFEQQMAVELTKFTTTLQGSSFASDQAYFVNAMALSAAASGTQQYVRPPRTVVNNSTTTATQQTETTPPGTAISPATLPVISSTDNTFGAFTSLNRNNATLPAALPFNVVGGINLEPNVVLEQKARYLNALHELRRINEGDDTADSPGYSLNLIRIPVSILPGKQTDIGYGAEITMTMTPHLSPELLPTTFRNLVANDLVDQIAFPVTQFINNPENNVYFNPDSAIDIANLFHFVEATDFDIDTDIDDVNKLKAMRMKLSLQALFTRPEWKWVSEFVEQYDEIERLISAIPKTAMTQWVGSFQSFPEESVYGNTQKQIPDNRKTSHRLRRIIKLRPKEFLLHITFMADSERKKVDAANHNWTDEEKEKHIKQFRMQSEPFKHFNNSREVENIRNSTDRMLSSFQLVGLSVPATKSRRARMPVPPSQFKEVYGYDSTYRFIADAYNVFAQERASRPLPDSSQITVHLPDIQGYLQEEIIAAQKLLAEPRNQDLWAFCNLDLVDLIRTRKSVEIAQKRKDFRTALQQRMQLPEANAELAEDWDDTTVSALAWAIIVESALLTDQLILDMKEASAAKGLAPRDKIWMDYYSPEPSPEARQAFNEYVRVRWPIRVFALDPVQQQQNIATTNSTRREMQLSLSLAFVNGQINANNMMRFARRLEFDSATIDINGTSVGFSSGDNTFGWRYYPRFQTPDIGSNTKVFFRDLLEGGPNRKQLLRERRLEPGMRECEAVVIMPSFVPYAELDVTSSWFKLINPKKKELDSKYTMRLSRQVKSAQNFASCVTDSQFYRDGDVLRLHHKIKQLESRLPMQSTMVQVPYENTLGGFGMFNTGVTDLAPELNGWYGAPAINPAADTTVFLVGNHFSVLSTKVIAGGLPLTTTELLSRQVMQVTIPAKSLQIGDERQKFVDVHLATPYGVTQHLLIPVASPASTGQTAGGGGGDGSDPPLSGPGWKTPKVSLAFVYGGLGIIAPPTGTPAVKPTPLLIVPGNDIKPETYDTVDVTLTFDKKIIPDPIVLKAVKYNADKKAYLLDGVVLSPAILSAAATVFGPEAFPPSTIAAKTTLKFKSTQSLGPDLDTKSGNDLTVNWIDASHLTKQP